jgi:hypothetical protein
MQATMDEQLRQGRITEGTKAIDKTFGQFDDNFFNNQRTGYLNYATPQLEDQFAKAQRELTFSLDRTGMLDSSARTTKEAELQKMYDTHARSIADQALAYQNQARSNIEGSRANLIATLNSTGNAEAAASSAINQASALSAPPAYSALGQLFGDFTSGLAQQAAHDRNYSLYGPDAGGRYSSSTQFFGPPRGAVQTR